MTEAYLDAMVAALEAHSWTSITPALVMVGPIPKHGPYPAIGVMTPRGDDDSRTRARATLLEAVEWTAIMPLELGDLTDPKAAETAHRKLLRAKHELRAIVHENQTWGVEHVLSTHTTGWTSAFLLDQGGGGLLQSLTVKMEVKCREPF